MTSIGSTSAGLRAMRSATSASAPGVRTAATGGDRVHRDAVAVQLAREPGGVALERRLRRPVGRGDRAHRLAGGERRALGWRDVTLDTLTIHPAPLARIPGITPWARSIGACTLSSYITRRRFSEISGRRQVERGGRVVDQDVDGTERGLGLGDDPGPVVAVGQVGHDRDGPPAGGLDPLDGLAQRPLEGRVRVGRARGHRDRGALRRGERGRATAAPMPRLAPVTRATFPSHAPTVSSPLPRRASSRPASP